MTTWNENDNPPEESPPEAAWEEGETNELAMREVSFRRRDPAAHDDDLAEEPGVAEPVAAELPLDDEPAALPTAPVASETEKVPFYKREISLGRKKRVEDSSAPPVSRPEPGLDAPSETAVTAAASATVPAAQTPASLRTRRNGATGGPGGTRVGVKITQTAISVAVVEDRDGVGELTTLARRALDPGVIVDGEVGNLPALTQALETLWAEEKLPRRGVRLGLFGSRVGVRPVDITGIDEDDRFANAVRFKAHEVLPIGVQESVLDYRVLGERVLESGELVRRTLLVVAPRDQVLPYVEAFRGARIGLEAVDIDALALLRAYVDPVQPGVETSQDSAAVVVSMDREGSTLLVSGGGRCEFTRAFDWGGNLLAAAVAEQLELNVERGLGRSWKASPARAPPARRSKTRTSGQRRRSCAPGSCRSPASSSARFSSTSSSSAHSGSQTSSSRVRWRTCLACPTRSTS